MINLNKISCDFEGKSRADPCNLLLYQNYIISSNYTGGSFTLSELDQKDKSLKKSNHYFSNSKKSHIHCAILTQNKKYIFITDLGEAKIQRFKISDNKDMKLVEHSVIYEYKNEAQPGPRHMIFSQDGKFLFVLCELDDLL